MDAVLGVEVLSVVVLTGSGLLAGVLLAVALGVVPAFAGLSPGQYVRVHKLVGQYYDRVMPPLAVLTVVLDVVLASRTGNPLPTTLFVLAAVFDLGVSAVSQFGNVPINRVVKKTDPDRIGSDWRDPRPRWRGWHLLRTALALVALLATASAVVTAL